MSTTQGKDPESAERCEEGLVTQVLSCCEVLYCGSGGTLAINKDFKVYFLVVPENADSSP